MGEESKSENEKSLNREFNQGDSVVFHDSQSEYDGETGIVTSVTEGMFGGLLYKINFERDHNLWAHADQINSIDENTRQIFHEGDKIILSDEKSDLDGEAGTITRVSKGMFGDLLYKVDFDNGQDVWARADQINWVVENSKQITQPNQRGSVDTPSTTESTTSSTPDEKGLFRKQPLIEVPNAPDVSVDYDTLTNREPIGSGGNADVSKATVPIPDGEVVVAIKQPRMAGTLRRETIERLLDEAETWDKLDDHDHIVGVVDYGRTPMAWIAMEYMNGGHLGDRTGEMETPQALWTALAVTKGVRHAHRRGIAHLDLKPENILFRTVADAWDVPKVADWGLSKQLLEHSKSVEGFSPQYAAPEQFSDEYGPADDITDIYQLGAVFYELFTGQPPFEGAPAKVMHQALNEQPTPPSEIATVPDGVDEIVLTALAKKKADRYDDIVYLRDEFQALIDSWSATHD